MIPTYLTVLIVLIGLVGLLSLGFVIAPRPFRPHQAARQGGETQPLRPDLPEPVRRHFFETLGEAPPVIHSAVVWGRGRILIRSVWMPFRFKGWYRPGEAFVRRMEITWFQRPVLRGRDTWLNEQGTYEMGGKIERGPALDQAQLQALWADAVWMPSVLIHDPRVQWEAVDAQTARMVVPFGKHQDSLLAHFDPQTGRMTHLSALRATEEGLEPEPWRVDLLAWKEYHGLLIPCQTDTAWGESGSPGVYWNLDGLVYNVNVSDQLG